MFQVIYLDRRTTPPNFELIRHPRNDMLFNHNSNSSVHNITEHKQNRKYRRVIFAKHLTCMGGGHLANNLANFELAN